MIYLADWLFTGEGAPVRDGWIQVEGDRIAATGSASGLPADLPPGGVRRLPGCAILPGLVNAHCHLELTGLHEKLDRGNPFPAWVGQLREHAAGFTETDYRAAADAGIGMLLAGGCTTVLDVGNTGAAIAALAESPLRSFACMETLGLDPALAEQRLESAIDTVKKNRGTGRFRPGLAPHSAYSCSPALLRSVLEYQASRALPVTLHAAESREEAALFAGASGPLQDFCKRIFPASPEHRGTSPVRWLDAEGLLPDGLILVHGNTLDDADMELLARCRATVVHCPSSHAFFGHPRFPYEALRARGINVALGTDSLASGHSLSMREQMRLFQETYPEVPFAEIVTLATRNGARALGLDDAGLLKPDYRADFIVTAPGNPETPGTPGDPQEVVIAGESYFGQLLKPSRR